MCQSKGLKCKTRHTPSLLLLSLVGKGHRKCVSVKLSQENRGHTRYFRQMEFKAGNWLKKC